MNLCDSLYRTKHHMEYLDLQVECSLSCRKFAKWKKGIDPCLTYTDCARLHGSIVFADALGPLLTEDGSGEYLPKY